jgi:hypothetical protein
MRRLNPWQMAQDLIGPADRWPKFVRKLFWESRLSYRERLILVCFAFNNGLSFHALMNCLRFTGPLKRKPTAEIKMEKLFHLFDSNEEYRAKYYSFDIELRKVTYLNGKVKPRVRSEI